MHGPRLGAINRAHVDLALSTSAVMERPAEYPVKQMLTPLTIGWGSSAELKMPHHFFEERSVAGFPPFLFNIKEIHAKCYLYAKANSANRAGSTSDGQLAETGRIDETTHWTSGSRESAD